MTLVPLSNWVLNPKQNVPEETENAGVVNDRARQQLTTEQSVLGSDIDNLDVLLNQLNLESEPSGSKSPTSSKVLTLDEKNLSPSQLNPSELKSSQPNSGLNVPSFSLNTPESIAGEESSTNSNGTPNLILRPAQVRNFFSNNPPSIQTTQSTLSLTSLPPETLNQSLPVSNSPLLANPPLGSPQFNSPQFDNPQFGNPQSLGLPQSSLSGPIAPVNSSPGVFPVSPNSSNSSGYGIPSTLSSGTSSPSLSAPLSSSSFVPSSNVGRSLPPAPNPYSLDPSFADPLTPAVQGIPQPVSPLAPGQYIGNGEINTFANP